MNQKILLNHQTCHFNCYMEASMKTSFTQKQYLEHMREIHDCELLVKTSKRVNYHQPYTNISILVCLSHVNQSLSKHLSNHKLESKKAIIPVKILRKHTGFVIRSESRNIYFKDNVIDDKNLYEAFRILASKDTLINNFVYRTGIIDRDTFVRNFVSFFAEKFESNSWDLWHLGHKWNIEWNKIFDNVFEFFDTLMKEVIKETKDICFVDIFFKNIVRKSHIFGDEHRYYFFNRQTAFFKYAEGFKYKIFNALKLKEKSYESLFYIDKRNANLYMTDPNFQYVKGYSDIYCELTKTKNYFEFFRIQDKLIRACSYEFRPDQEHLIRMYNKYLPKLDQYLDKPKFRRIFVFELMRIRYHLCEVIDSFCADAISCYIERLNVHIVYCINKSNNTQAAKFFIQNHNSRDYKFWENFFFPSLKKNLASRELVNLYLRYNPERIFEQKIIKLNTMNFLKTFIKKRPSFVLDLPKKFRTNKTLWKIAVEKSYKVLANAPIEIKEDKEIIKLASRINKDAIKSSSIKLKSDVKFLQSFCSPREAFAYASEKTKINPKCCVEVLRKHPSDIKLISKRNILKLPFSKFTLSERKKLFKEFTRLSKLKDILEIAIYKKTFLIDV